MRAPQCDTPLTAKIHASRKSADRTRCWERLYRDASSLLSSYNLKTWTKRIPGIHCFQSHLIRPSIEYLWRLKSSVLVRFAKKYLEIDCLLPKINCNIENFLRTSGRQRNNTSVIHVDIISLEKVRSIVLFGLSILSEDARSPVIDALTKG